MIEPRRDEPFPIWMIFPVVFVAVYLTHFTLLRLPYYWDEAGYYIPAAWDFFRTGSLIPTSTLTNAHPPLPSIYLALWWKASGFYPEVTREAVVMVASLGLLGVWRLVQRLQGSPWVAFWTAVLTGALSHLVFPEHAGACGHLRGRIYDLGAGVFVAGPGSQAVGGGLWFTAAVLSKETAVAIPVTLAAISFIDGIAVVAGRRALALWREAAWLASCVVPLAAWYGWHYAKTGFLFGNPEFFRYNAQATLAPDRVLAAFFHRILHLTAAHEYVCASAADGGGPDAASQVECRRPAASGDQPAVRRRIFCCFCS